MIDYIRSHSKENYSPVICLGHSRDNRIYAFKGLFDIILAPRTHLLTHVQMDRSAENSCDQIHQLRVHITLKVLDSTVV